MAIDLKTHAVKACLRLLRPVVAMLLKNGVMHREFVEMSKAAYVSVATDGFGIRGRPTNVSRVALLTGLDRKEISRIRQSLVVAPQSEPEHRQNRIARLLAGWHQDREFLDDSGKPQILPLEGDGASFASLVSRYGGDVPGTAILKELQRVGAVRREKGRLQVLKRNYRLASAEPEAVSRAGSVWRDLGDTVVHNLYCDANDLTRFEARASNSRIPLRHMPAYRSFLRGESQVFLERVDAWLSDHEAPQGIADGQLARLGVGVYWIQSDGETVTLPAQPKDKV